MKDPNLEKLPDQIFWMKRQRKKSDADIQQKFLKTMKQDENIQFKSL